MKCQHNQTKPVVKGVKKCKRCFKIIRKPGVLRKALELESQLHPYTVRVREELRNR